jgi:hypothetical protein
MSVFPVSIDPSGEDENSLVLDPQRTAFPVNVTAWAGLPGSSADRRVEPRGRCLGRRRDDVVRRTGFLAAAGYAPWPIRGAVRT